jgi:hypothetical protein
MKSQWTGSIHCAPRRLGIPHGPPWTRSRTVAALHWSYAVSPLWGAAARRGDRRRKSGAWWILFGAHRTTGGDASAGGGAKRWRQVLLSGSAFGVGTSKNGGGMSCGAGLPQSRAPFYRVRAVGGGRLLVMELQGTGGECPLMTLVLGEGMRGDTSWWRGRGGDVVMTHFPAGEAARGLHRSGGAGKRHTAARSWGWRWPEVMGQLGCTWRVGPVLAGMKLGPLRGLGEKDKQVD